MKLLLSLRGRLSLDELSLRNLRMYTNWSMYMVFWLSGRRGAITLLYFFYDADLQGSICCIFSLLVLLTGVEVYLTLLFLRPKPNDISSIYYSYALGGLAISFEFFALDALFFVLAYFSRLALIYFSFVSIFTEGVLSSLSSQDFKGVF